MFDQSLRVQLTRAMLIDDIEQVIRRTPGLTATEIARMLYGADGYHQRVGSPRSGSMRPQWFFAYEIMDIASRDL